MPRFRLFCDIKCSVIKDFFLGGGNFEKITCYPFELNKQIKTIKMLGSYESFGELSTALSHCSLVSHLRPSYQRSTKSLKIISIDFYGVFLVIHDTSLSVILWSYTLDSNDTVPRYSKAEIGKSL